MALRTCRVCAVGLLLGAALAGCGDPLATRMAAMNRFVGQPEQVLIQLMGVPTRRYEAAGLKYLAYDERRVEILPGVGGIGPWYAGGIPPQLVERWCETTFQVSDATVRSFTLRGNACG
jgi:hypothetical protein